MEIEDRRKALLDINYNKLLTYLAGVLVFFFTLFQVIVERDNLTPHLAVLISFGSLIGVVFFIVASYKNHKEIIDLENKLGISDILKPSCIFSQRKTIVVQGEKIQIKERKVSIVLKGLLFILLAFSVFLFLVTLQLTGMMPRYMEEGTLMLGILLMLGGSILRYVYRCSNEPLC